MNSFNHYAYGAIGDWMYRVITGIDTYEEGPEYKQIKIKPHLGGNLSHANADLETFYGKISSHWKKENERLHLDVEYLQIQLLKFILLQRMQRVLKKVGKHYHQ